MGAPVSLNLLWIGWMPTLATKPTEPGWPPPSTISHNQQRNPQCRHRPGTSSDLPPYDVKETNHHTSHITHIVTLSCCHYMNETIKTVTLSLEWRSNARWTSCSATSPHCIP